MMASGSMTPPLNVPRDTGVSCVPCVKELFVFLKVVLFSESDMILHNASYEAKRGGCATLDAWVGFAV